METDILMEDLPEGIHFSIPSATLGPVSKEDGTVTWIRPRGSVLGLLPFGPQVLLLVVTILAAWYSAAAGRRAIAIALVLSATALVMWQAMYHLPARIVIRSRDRRVEIRGRLISRVVNGGEIRSAVLYGPPGTRNPHPWTQHVLDGMLSLR